MYSLQTSVDIGQASFKIRNKGDFRMVLDCFKVFDDPELSNLEKFYAVLIIFYEDFNSIEDILAHFDIWDELKQGMNTFFNSGDAESKSNTGGYRLVDWTKDSNLICSAINNVAKQEVRALDYLHWWTFMSYYTAIGECPFADILAIRYKIASGTKLEKHEQKFRQNNPDYFDIDYRSESQKEADSYIKELWGGE